MFLGLFATLGSYFASGFLKGLIELSSVVLKTALEFISWYLSQFWKGLGVIFQNLSTLTVILAIIIGSGYYFKTWDNDKVLQQCINTCPNPIKQEKYYHPLKKKVYQAVGKKIEVTKPKPAPTKTFNPFGVSNGG
jgi:hypothetical protein